MGKQQGRVLLGGAASIGFVVLGVLADNPIVFALAVAAGVILAVYGVALYGGWVGAPTKEEPQSRSTAIRHTGGGRIDMDRVSIKGFDRAVETDGSLKMRDVETEGPKVFEASPVAHDPARYPPYLDQVPRERFAVELAAYCQDRQQLLVRGEALRSYLLGLDTEAQRDDRWQQRHLRPWIVGFQMHEAK